ncbi:hypothetical protein ACE6H2_008687 [Prunus campanulata]
MEVWDKPIMEKANILRLCDDDDAAGGGPSRDSVGTAGSTRRAKDAVERKALLVLVFSAGGGPEEMGGSLVHDVAEREWREGKSGDCLLTFYVFQPMRARCNS